MLKKILTVVFVVFLLTGCGSENGVKKINALEASKRIGKRNTLLIDCRTPEEFVSGHIPGAILLPLDELEKKVSELDKNKVYIVICRSGNRSTTFTDSLHSKGFKNVYNVLGGMNEWSGEVVSGNN